jgi:hypothetical protein
LIRKDPCTVRRCFFLRFLLAVIILSAAFFSSACRELQDLRQIKADQDLRIRELQKQVDAKTNEAFKTTQQSRTEIEAL